MGHGRLETIAVGLGFPECPRWYRGHLLVSDMLTKELVQISADGSRSVLAQFPNRPGGTGELPDGSLVCVSMQDCRLLRQDAAGWVEIADLAAITDGWLNDLVVDAAGRCYVGDTKGRRNEDGTITEVVDKPTRIMMFAPGGPPRVVASNMATANGMVITADGTTLITAETETRRLTAFTIADDGSLVDRRVFADLQDEVPNGISADVEGAVWVASHRGSVLRVAEGGAVTDRVDVRGGGSRQAIACMLGGRDRKDLFIVSAESEDTMPTRREPYDNIVRESGRVDVLSVDVPGAGWP